MVKSFSERTQSAVPSGTIRKSYDLYANPNFEGTPLSTGRLSNGAILTNIDGKTYKDLHTGPPERVCAICSTKIRPGITDSLRVPIGAWAATFDGSCNTGRLLEAVRWGGDKWSGGDFPERLNDDTATNCAGGSLYSYNEYPTRDSTYRFERNNNSKTNKCFIGTANSRENDEENCITAGIHYPTFCQLGDNVEFDFNCRAQCTSSRANDGKNNYCNFALDRVCGKTTKDYIRKNPLNTKLLSDRNWIKEPICQNYCGNAEQDYGALCNSHKSNFCKTRDLWDSDSETQQYCYDYWQKNKNINEVNQTCENDLLSSDNSKNITSGEKCGFLCRGEGLDFDESYCKTKRKEFCQKDNNMFTKYCFNFCKDEPDLCEEHLQNICPSKANELDNLVNDTGKKISDWCGCMMGTQFYQDYRDSTFKAFKDAGFNIEGASNVRTDPECIFPQCKAGAVRTSDQQENVKNCAQDCLQFMLNDFSEADITGDFFAEQEANCDKINVIQGGPADSNPPPQTTIPVTSEPPQSTDEINIPDETDDNPEVDGEDIIEDQTIIDITRGFGLTSSDDVVTKSEGDSAIGVLIAIIIGGMLFFSLIFWLIFRNKKGNDFKVDSSKYSWQSPKYRQ